MGNEVPITLSVLLQHLVAWQTQGLMKHQTMALLAGLNAL
jgi:hypothetical protein